MIKSKLIAGRHFTFKHPLFRASSSGGGVRWQDSVYYLWWEFLRRHEGYRQTCERGGRGQCSELYEDFGDVHKVNFREWWTEGNRGARLFAEPASLGRVIELSPSDLGLLQNGWDPASQMVVAIPLAFPKRDIFKRVREIVKKRHGRKRGERLLKGSKALYPIAAQFSIHSLKTTLKVHDLALSRPNLKQWEIAQELGFTVTLKPNELGKRGVAGAPEKKATMSVAVARKLAHARRIIAGVGSGKFPVP